MYKYLNEVLIELFNLATGDVEFSRNVGPPQEMHLPLREISTARDLDFFSLALYFLSSLC